MTEPTYWTFWLADSDRSAGWTNHCFILQYVCQGFGLTALQAAQEATARGAVPEGFEPDRCIALPREATTNLVTLPCPPTQQPVTKPEPS